MCIRDSLQPVIENAIHHGSRQSTGGTTYIKIRISRFRGMIKVRILNTGAGMTPPQLCLLYTSPVTAFVERIVLEVTAAPHTDGIIIGAHTLTQQLLRALRGDSCQDCLLYTSPWPWRYFCADRY